MPHKSIVITGSSRTRFKFPLARPELFSAVSAMLTVAGAEGAILEIALVDDVAMAELNREYLGCHGPTNCLSFPAPFVDGENFGTQGESGNLGWLALSTDTLRREAFMFGQEPAEHGLALLAHGLAHLMGLDHGMVMDDLAGRMLEAGAAALQKGLKTAGQEEAETV